MGQQQSSFVVEIAGGNRYGKFQVTISARRSLTLADARRLQSLPQKDPEDDGSASKWRITVNPASELQPTDGLRALISRLYHVQTLLHPSDVSQRVVIMIACF